MILVINFVSAIMEVDIWDFSVLVDDVIKLLRLLNIMRDGVLFNVFDM